MNDDCWRRFKIDHSYRLKFDYKIKFQRLCYQRPEIFPQLVNQNPAKPAINGQSSAGVNKLLSKRFGPIPSEITAKISTATLEDIERWFDRAIDASQLSGVFDR